VHIDAATSLPEFTDAVDQRLSPVGGPDLYWQTLVEDGQTDSAVYVAAGETLVVALNTWGDTNGYAIADAVRVDWAADLNPGSPLHAVEFGTGHTFAAGLGTRPEGPTEGLPATSDLTTATVQGALRQAVSQWQSTDLTADEMARLSSVQVQGASLPGTMLGYALSDAPIIYVDYDAAGHGWKYDGPRTKDAAEWSIPHSMDLVTVLAHELGHVLGHEDLDPASHTGHVMSATLAAGDQRTVISGQRSALGTPRSGIDDAWSMFGEFDDSAAASRIAPPVSGHLPSEVRHLKSGSAFPVRDALFARLFARLDDRAGAIADDDAFTSDDGTSDEAEDGLDLWSLL
jgi:hypothetical protein